MSDTTFVDGETIILAEWLNDVNDGTYGVRSVTLGGTGAATAAGARTSLGLGNVNDTSDADKPVSTAQQTALDLKVDENSPVMLASAVLPKTSGVGLQVDTAAPSFGFHDMLGEFNARGVGAADPNFAVYGATAQRAYSFSATVMQQCWFVFHIPHDYVPGTDIYFHVHWSNAAAVPNTGNVIWGFQYTYARGYNQQAFPAETTITVTQASPATRYQHNIAETVAITIANLEPDGILLVRVYRDATAGGDTCTDEVFGHTCDVHYQSTGMATKAKNFPFYT